MDFSQRSRRLFRSPWLYLIIISLLVLVFHRTPNISFRHVGKNCDFRTLEDCGSIVQTSNYQLAFVEFDDQGYYHDQRQAFLAHKLLRSYFKNNSSDDVFVFVHGWNNNASPENSNVKQFQKFLELKAEQHPDRKTLGVYIGWPGETLKPPLNYLTFWSRKAAAHRVASGSIQEFFATIKRTREEYQLAALEQEKASAEHQAPDKDDAASDEIPRQPKAISLKDAPSIYLIGHSFGGLIAYQANSQSYALQFGDQKSFLPDPTNLEEALEVEGIGELLILINPAIEAGRFSTVKSLSSEYPNAAFRNPKMVVLSSQTDWATKYAFPLGRLPSRLFSDQLKSGQLSDALATVGNSRFYHTHTASLDADGQTMLCSTIMKQEKGWRETRKAPFWFVSAKASLLDGHSDLDGEKLLSFFRALSTGLDNELEICPLSS